MKIGIDCREITKHTTGIARFLLSFLGNVRVYTNEYEFILFGNQYTDFSRRELDGYKKIQIYERNTLYFDQIQLLNAINQYKIDLFFSPYYKFPIFSKIPIVTTIFDVMYLVLKEYRNSLKSKWIKNFIKLFYNKVSKVITGSNAAKNDIIKICGLPEDKVEVIYLAVDKKFNPQSSQRIQEVKQKYGLTKKYILYVGNSNHHKNLNRLIEAYSLLPEKIKNEYQLVLAGVKNQHMITTLLPDTGYLLLMIPYVLEEDLSSLYSGAEIFVFPSLYEGFGLPPLEAMACGCPVVSSNTSSLPEILKDAAIYFNPYDILDIKNTLERTILDIDLKNELKQKGTKRIEDFSLEKMILNLLKVLNIER